MLTFDAASHIAGGIPGVTFVVRHNYKSLSSRLSLARKRAGERLSWVRAWTAGVAVFFGTGNFEEVEAAGALAQ